MILDVHNGSGSMGKKSNGSRIRNTVFFLLKLLSYGMLFENMSTVRYEIKQI